LLIGDDVMSYADDAGIGMEVGKTVWWPGEITDYVNQTYTAIKILEDDIVKWKASNPTDETRINFKKAFDVYVESWNKFASEYGVLGSLTYGTVQTAYEYRKELAKWRERFIELGGSPTGPVPELPAKAPVSLIRLGVYGGLALGGAYLIVKLIEAWKSPSTSKSKAPGIRGVAIQSPIKTVRGG
jgi:hypothetical protein